MVKLTLSKQFRILDKAKKIASSCKGRGQLNSAARWIELASKLKLAESVNEGLWEQLKKIRLLGMTAND